MRPLGTNVPARPIIRFQIAELRMNSLCLIMYSELYCTYIVGKLYPLQVTRYPQSFSLRKTIFRANEEKIGFSLSLARGSFVSRRWSNYYGCTCSSVFARCLRSIFPPTVVGANTNGISFSLSIQPGMTFEELKLHSGFEFSESFSILYLHWDNACFVLLLLLCRM